MLAICIIFGVIGKVLGDMEGFIVGGDYAPIHKYPHAVFLMVACTVPDSKFATEMWMCGSSIINQKILLTAAHCIYPCAFGTRIIANLGSEHRQNGLLRSANGYTVHERYVPANNSFDVGLVKLIAPVRLTSKMSRVAIMKRPPYNEQASLTGWGLTDETTNKTEANLKVINQKVWRHESCIQMFGYIPKGTICASSKKRQQFASKGDSGSALVVRGYIQIGLVSYKIPRLANNVVIFTDVGYYYEWITYHAHRLYCYTQLT